MRLKIQFARLRMALAVLMVFQLGGCGLDAKQLRQFPGDFVHEWMAALWF